VSEFTGVRGARHFAAGLYRRGTRPLWLTLATGLLSIVVLADILSAHEQGISFRDAYGLAMDGDWIKDMAWVVCEITVLCAFLPCLIGFLEIALPDSWFDYNETTRAAMRPWRVVLAIVLVFATALIWLAPSMISTAGPRVTLLGRFDAWQSLTAWALDARHGLPTTIVTALASLVWSVGWGLWQNLATGSQKDKLLRRYRRVQIHGLRWPSMPRPGRLEFDVARLAPQLPRLTKQVEADIEAEEKQGSLNRGNDIGFKGIASDVEHDLAAIGLSPRHSREDYRLEFVSSAWRALEIILCRTPKERLIVVSPFERQMTYTVAAMSSMKSALLTPRISREPGLLNGDTGVVTARVVELIGRHIDMQKLNPLPPITLIISIVDYVSGRALPVMEVRSGLQSLYGSDVDVILDATHAAGNLHARIPNVNFAACFAPTHKWLMSPYRGAFMWCRSAAIAAYEPLDAWSSSTSTIRVDLRALVSVRAACNFWVHFTVDEIEYRLEVLRADLLQRLEPELVDAYTANGCALQNTGIVSVVPGTNFKWRSAPGELQAAISHRGLQAGVVEVDDGRLAVRLCISTVTDGDQVNRAARILRSLITPV